MGTGELTGHKTKRPSRLAGRIALQIANNRPSVDVV